jgi:hypothetical protein
VTAAHLRRKRGLPSGSIRFHDAFDVLKHRGVAGQIGQAEPSDHGHCGDVHGILEVMTVVVGKLARGFERCSRQAPLDFAARGRRAGELRLAQGGKKRVQE